MQLQASTCEHGIELLIRVAAVLNASFKGPWERLDHRLIDAERSLETPAMSFTHPT